MFSSWPSFLQFSLITWQLGRKRHLDWNMQANINEIYLDFVRICTGVKQSYQWSPILCMCLNDNMTTHQYLHSSPNLRIISRVINSEVNMRPSMEGRSRPSNEGRHVVIRNATQTSQKHKNSTQTSFNFNFSSTPSCLPFPHINETAGTFSLSDSQKFAKCWDLRDWRSASTLFWQYLF